MNNVHHPQLDDDRLMLLSWSTPVLAQFVMLIIMCMQRHWLYVLMLAPGLLGSALSLAVMAIRSRRARQATSQADTGISNSQTSPDLAIEPVVRSLTNSLHRLRAIASSR